MRHSYGGFKREQVVVTGAVRPKHFANKRGVIVSLNEGELGVQLQHRDLIAWFRPSELTLALRQRKPQVRDLAKNS